MGFELLAWGSKTPFPLALAKNTFPETPISLKLGNIP